MAPALTGRGLFFVGILLIDSPGIISEKPLFGAGLFRPGWVPGGGFRSKLFPTRRYPVHGELLNFIGIGGIQDSVEFLDRTPKRVFVDISFPTGQSNLNLSPSGDCDNGTQRKRNKKTVELRPNLAQ